MENETNPLFNEELYEHLPFTYRYPSVKDLTADKIIYNTRSYRSELHQTDFASAVYPEKPISKLIQ